MRSSSFGHYTRGPLHTLEAPPKRRTPPNTRGARPLLRFSLHMEPPIKYAGREPQAQNAATVVGVSNSASAEEKADAERRDGVVAAAQ